jgi:hypothetical protein
MRDRVIAERGHDGSSIASRSPREADRSCASGYPNPQCDGNGGLRFDACRDEADAEAGADEPDVITHGA